MGHIGNTAQTAFTSFDKQTITGSGSTTYTLTHSVANEREIEVFVNNVRQEPSVAYNVSGNQITFTENIASTDTVYVNFQGKAVQTVSHPSDQPLQATTGNFSGAVSVGTIKEGTGTNTAMTIDSNGNILKPNLICFDYYLSADQNLTNNAWTKLTFDTKAFERGGNNFNTTDNRFVAPIDGIYMFSTQVNHHADTASGGYQYSGFYKNGSPYRYTSGLRIHNQQIRADHTQTGSVMMELSANDYVEVYAFNNASGGNPVVFSGIGRCGFSGYLVG
jgi:hypothetical protein